jgi:hypothetical protein
MRAAWSALRASALLRMALASVSSSTCLLESSHRRSCRHVDGWRRGGLAAPDFSRVVLSGRSGMLSYVGACGQSGTWIMSAT